MANNRIYLRCRQCGEVLFLGKSFCEGYYYRDYSKTPLPLEKKLNDFYDVHTYCDREKTEAPFKWDEKCFHMPDDCFESDGSFDIVYEQGRLSGYEPPTVTPETYADLIRSMNDEELAEYIIDVIIEAYEHVNIPVNNRCEAIRDYLKALKQPTEDAE